MSERGAFLSRGEIFRTLGSTTGALANAHAAKHATLAHVSTFEQLQAFGRDNGVAWYVADTPAAGQRLVGVRDRCGYCGQAVQVYDLR